LNFPGKIVFVNSHPVQYFAPLYKYLNQHGVETLCWYCSDENVKGHKDRQFGVTVSWDVPLLEGYSYRFFKNSSWKPSIYNGFFGLINLGMIRALFSIPRSVVVVHGWSAVTNVLVLIFAKAAGHVVCLRGESPLHQELLKSQKNLFIKRFLLTFFLFRFVNKFLYIGKENKAFYKHYGVEERRMLFAPYAVDNDRFKKVAAHFSGKNEDVRNELKLPSNKKIVLFAAKYIAKKRPLDLMEAFRRLPNGDACLVMVGDGELRTEMTDFINRHSLHDIILTGFVNQQDIGKYYSVADVFVMCSGAGETWGLSVNEALNFNIPVVVSDMSGCSSDLVRNGENGYIFKTGNIEDLTAKITSALLMGKRNNDELLKIYSFETIEHSLRQL